MPGSPLHPRVLRRLCAYWFVATGALGILYPYFSLFLRENVGLTTAQVGLALAIQPLVGIVAQPAWGQLADRTGSRVGVLTLLGLGSALGYAALSRAAGLEQVVLAVLLLAIFQSALFPLATSVSFGLLDAPRRFGIVRVWGTLGYLALVVATPRLLHALRARFAISASAGGPSEPGLERMFYLAAALSLFAAWLAYGLRAEPGLSERARPDDLRALLRSAPFLRLLALVTGAQLFLNGPIQLFPLFVRARGGTINDLSDLWVFMLLFEAPLIFRSGELFRRFGVTRVMIASIAGGGARWLWCACVPTLALAYPVQALHALVVTGLGVGSALHVEQIVAPRLRATAQALLVMVGTSIGGGLSNALGGAALDRFGIDPTFFCCGLGALVWAVGWSRAIVRDETARHDDPGAVSRVIAQKG